jgi:hypothetical protein
MELLAVKKVSDDLYMATLTRDDPDFAWSTTEPMRGQQLYTELVERKCHPIDVADAMFAADPESIEMFRGPKTPLSRGH